MEEETGGPKEKETQKQKDGENIIGPLMKINSQNNFAEEKDKENNRKIIGKIIGPQKFFLFITALASGRSEAEERAAAKRRSGRILKHRRSLFLPAKINKENSKRKCR